MILKQGDTIGIIALSGECNKESVLSAKEYFEKLGFNIKLSKNIFDSDMYLAGNDDEKAEELERFFLDKDIKLIINARGGYGGIRLLNKLNYNIIKKSSKPFCGFSDTTSLLLMIYKKAGIVTYHSPMAISDFAENVDLYTQENFFKAVNGEHLAFEASKIYNEVNVKGILWGGNLSTVVSLCGQDFIPRRNFIFFAEDINEPVYKIDKMFTQLFNIPVFKQYCKGVVIGDFLGVDNPEWLEQFFVRLSKSINISMIKLDYITHNKRKITLPIGKMAQIKSNKISIL